MQTKRIRIAKYVSKSFGLQSMSLYRKYIFVSSLAHFTTYKLLTLLLLYSYSYKFFNDILQGCCQIY